jgi:uncharacterized phiE125 gp8 family phage protein
LFTSIISKEELDLVTLEEAMEHSRIDDAYDELVVRGCLSAAHSLVEAQLNRHLNLTNLIAVKERYSRKIQLPYAPLKSVNSITCLDEDLDSVTLVSGLNYRVDLVRNMVILDPDTCSDYSEFNIDYYCGYKDLESVPKAILHAIKMTSATLYEMREDSVVGTIVSRVPLNVKRILAPFRLMSGV